MSEFKASDDVAKIVRSLKENGYVLVRQALAPDVLGAAGRSVSATTRQLSEVIGKPINELPLCFADQDADFNLLAFSAFERGWYYEGDRNFRAKFWEMGPQFPNRIIQAILNSPLPQIYTTYYGGDAVASYEHSTVRFQGSHIKNLSFDFHQDGNYHTRDPLQHTGLTTWIPFTKCGEDAPGLELVRKKMTDVLPPPTGSDGAVLAVDRNFVMDHYASDLWAPNFEVGDVLVFDSLTVHRTHLTDSMSAERQSSDFRVYPKENLPDYIKELRSWMIPFGS